MSTTNRLARAGVAALFATLVACGGEPAPETTAAPPPTSAPAPPPPPAAPAAPTAETFPVPADYQAAVATEITPENVEAQLAALEAEDSAEATAPAAAPAAH